MPKPSLVWKKTTFLKAACYALLLSLIFTPLGHPQAMHTAPVAEKVLQEAALNGEADFLVVFKDQPGQALAKERFSTAREQGQVVLDALRASADRSQQGLLSQLRQEGIPSQPFWIVNLIALRGPASLIQSIAGRPEVAYIVSNAPFRAALEKPDSGRTAASSTVEWNLDWVHAPQVWAMGASGQGIVYANADTGVQWDHPALKGQYRGWDSASSTADHNFNWHDAITSASITGSASNPCGYDSPSPCDDYGHGTHTMGIGVGSTSNLGTQIGMAPGAKWISCRNMDSGVGRPSTYLDCFQFFLAPTDLSGANSDPSKRPDVVGNSYDCPASEQCIDLRVMQSAVASLRAAGIFMAVSAGNRGSSCSTISTPPGLEPGVFTVGATGYQANAIAGFSSRGPVQIDGQSWLKPDLVAPGSSVYSSYLGSTYTSLSGTSMAAPMVAGAVALLWSARPDLRRDIDRTETVLRLSALHLPAAFGSASLCGTDLADTIPNNTYGYGELDVLAAVNYNPHVYYWPFVTN